MKKNLKLNTITTSLKFVRVLFTSIIIFIIGYGLLVYFGSTISTFPVCEKEDVEIYILSNGIHTDIVVPTTNNITDWSTLFPPSNSTRNENLPLLALGWGSKGFYLETPTWNDLTFSTAAKAVFGLSESAIHATYHQNITPNNKNCFKVTLSNRQYKLLCKYITESLKLEHNKSIYISTDANYGDTDAFYEAQGAYNLFYTCNTWANNALKSCEQRTALWTPFDKGILQHYKK